nr:unnamed protein product [Digitaria exilis]
MTTPVVSASAPAISGAPVAAAASQAGRPPAAPRQQLPIRRPQLQYAGVRRGPNGEWLAHVLVDPERGEHRTVGPFPDEHAAALAHDRIAIAFLGDSARANFRPAFHQIEQRFLRLCRTRAGEIDVCRLVAEGTYEDRYATFLRSVLALQRWGEYLNVVIDFFVGRAGEIGEEALVEGGEKLAARFVEMHRNKATRPEWREGYREEDRRKQQQQQRDGGCAGASAVQPLQQQQKVL